LGGNWGRIYWLLQTTVLPETKRQLQHCSSLQDKLAFFGVLCPLRKVEIDTEWDYEAGVIVTPGSNNQIAIMSATVNCLLAMKHKL